MQQTASELYCGGLPAVPRDLRNMVQSPLLNREIFGTHEPAMDSVLCASAARPCRPAPTVVRQLSGLMLRETISARSTGGLVGSAARALSF